MSKEKILSEENLLTLLKQDNIQAFDELYWKYQKAVFRNVLRLTRDVAAAEDIVQEVFVSLWERRSSLDTQRSVGGWLFVSSYNRAVNVLKRKLKESQIIHELEPVLAGNNEGQDQYEAQLTILEGAIRELSLQKRKVFELCKLQGKTYEEAAADMNISKHTVKEYLSEAIAAIKEYASRQSGTGLLLIATINI
jgi:RNA polymerase sigma-70 factor (ECF subfamily)